MGGTMQEIDFAAGVEPKPKVGLNYGYFFIVEEPRTRSGIVISQCVAKFLLDAYESEGRYRIDRQKVEEKVAQANLPDSFPDDFKQFEISAIL